MARALVTGGLGFIGGNFVRRMTNEGRSTLIADAYSYAADERRLEGCDPALVEIVAADVSARDFVDLVVTEKPEVIIHFAAETHVTRSEGDPDRFFRSNVEGTRRVLEAAERAETPLVVHISTDEVYGPCLGQAFREEDKLPGEGLATSAYARSKALADDLAREFAQRVPVIVVRPTNCFGPWQHPEKAVPRWCTRALRGEPLPVWGDGGQVRDWMFVEDACAAIETVIERGEPSAAYNIGPGGDQVTNLELAQMIAVGAGRSEDAVYLTAYDRPDHDRRYAIDAARIKALGWRPEMSLQEALTATIEWYDRHRAWWSHLVPEAERLYEDAIVREPQK